MRKVTWRRFYQSAKQLVVGQTTMHLGCCVVKSAYLLTYWVGAPCVCRTIWRRCMSLRTAATCASPNCCSTPSVKSARAPWYVELLPLTHSVHFYARTRYRPRGGETICPPPILVRRWHVVSPPIRPSWIQKSRSIYAHLWWPAVAKLQAASVPIA